MRAFIVIGVLLIALGGLILAGKLNYKTSEQVVDVGILKAEVHEKKSLPEWAGVVALIAGVGFLLYGRRGGRSSAAD
jgi:hypothetical protein